jgi:DNA-binding IscR family transcriptional regulator
VLGRDPETVAIKDILDCVKNSGKKAKVPEDRSPEEDEIDDLFASVDLSMTKALEGKTLQSLILSLPPPDAQE